MYYLPHFIDKKADAWRHSVSIHRQKIKTLDKATGVSYPLAPEKKNVAYVGYSSIPLLKIRFTFISVNLTFFQTQNDKSG